MLQLGSDAASNAKSDDAASQLSFGDGISEDALSADSATCEERHGIPAGAADAYAGSREQQGDALPPAVAAAVSKSPALAGAADAHGGPQQQGEEALPAAARAGVAPSSPHAMAQLRSNDANDADSDAVGVEFCTTTGSSDDVLSGDSVACQGRQGTLARAADAHEGPLQEHGEALPPAAAFAAPRFSAAAGPADVHDGYWRQHGQGPPTAPRPPAAAARGVAASVSDAIALADGAAIAARASARMEFDQGSMLSLSASSASSRRTVVSVPSSGSNASSVGTKAASVVSRVLRASQSALSIGRRARSSGARSSGQDIQRPGRSFSMTELTGSWRQDSQSTSSVHNLRRATEVLPRCESARLRSELATRSLEPSHEDTPRGIIHVDDALELTETAFEIKHAPEASDPASWQMYTFKRSAKQSVMLSLGMLPRNDEAATAAGGVHASPDVFGPYAHASEFTCTLMYMAVVVGDGMLLLSRGMANCGWIPGLAILWGVSWLHHFICTRFVEVPQLLEQNFETFSGVAAYCFGRHAGALFTYLCVYSWAGTCTVSLRSISFAFRMVMYNDDHPAARWSFVLCLLVSPLALRTNAKALHRSSVVAIGCMVCVAVLESVCALYRGFFSRRGGGLGPVSHRWWGSRADILAGTEDFVSAYVGIGMLPYIVAEMLAPAKAHRVISKACRGITAIYTWVAIVCYFGWGEDVVIRAPIQEVVMQGPEGETMAKVIFFVLGIRTIAAYPIFFWAMWREINMCLGGFERAATEVRLPWAIRLKQRFRQSARIGLVVLTWAPLAMSPRAYHFYRDRMIKLPNMLVNFVFPAIGAVVAIISHQARHGAQASWMYVGGNILLHMAATLASASVVLWFFCVMMVKYLLLRVADCR